MNTSNREQAHTHYRTHKHTHAHTQLTELTKMFTQGRRDATAGAWGDVIQQLEPEET